MLLDYKTFENSVAAQEKVLNALYARPQVVNEVLSQMYRERTTEICRLK